jgi:hypothetical protein
MCFAQLLLQCLVVSSPMDGANENISNPIFSILVCALLLECSSMREIQSPWMWYMKEGGSLGGHMHKPKGFLFVIIRTLHSIRLLWIIKGFYMSSDDKSKHLKISPCNFFFFLGVENSFHLELYYSKTSNVLMGSHYRSWTAWIWEGRTKRTRVVRTASTKRSIPTRVALQNCCQGEYP